MTWWQTLLTSSAMAAAIVTALNAALLAIYNNRTSRQIEALKGTISDRSFFREQAYAREYRIYKDLWPSVHEISANIRAGDMSIERSAKINLTKKQIEDRAERLSSGIRDSLNHIHRVRPFVPGEIHALVSKFTVSARLKVSEWKNLVSWQVTPEAAARTAKIEAMAEEILDLLRQRLNWQGEIGTLGRLARPNHSSVPAGCEAEAPSGADEQEPDRRPAEVVRDVAGDGR
jgi:hypothetical protein